MTDVLMRDKSMPGAVYWACNTVMLLACQRLVKKGKLRQGHNPNTFRKQIGA